MEIADLWTPAVSDIFSYVKILLNSSAHQICCRQVSVLIVKCVEV